MLGIRSATAGFLVLTTGFLVFSVKKAPHFEFNIKAYHFLITVTEDSQSSYNNPGEGFIPGPKEGWRSVTYDKAEGT